MEHNKRFEEEQTKLAEAFESFTDSDTTGYMEDEALISSLKILREKVFNLSYEKPYIIASETEKKLCSKIEGKWDKDEGSCIIHFAKGY